MATVRICDLLWRSAATIVLAMPILLALPQTISPDTGYQLPNITVENAFEEGDTELNLTLEVETIELPQNKTEYDIPDYPGKKSFMPYNLFGRNSKQYQLQQRAVTDENGLQVVDGRYCIAIGTRFEAVIGQYVDLVLANGVVIPCIVGDIKAVKDTDSTNTFSKNGCCSEFIVNMEKLTAKSKRMGDISYINELWKSPVQKIIVWR